MTLDEIATRHPTDKGTGGYFPFYERHLGPDRESVRRVLEIGIDRGHSLRLWRDWFPNADVVGLDINPGKCFSGEPRITCLAGDSRGNGTAAALAEYGPFDVLIDDGGHHTSEHHAVLNNLAGLVVPGGWLVIEDMGTQVMDRHKAMRDVPHLTTIDMLMVRYMAMCNGRPHCGDFSEMHLYPSIAFLRRKS